MSKIERRYRPHAELRIAGTASGLGMLQGNAIVYNSPSENLGGFVELIKPGAFTESLKTADVRCLIDHNSSLLLGRNTSGTLRLFDGPEALRIENDLPDTSYARDLVVALQPRSTDPAFAGRSDLDGMSFGFIAIEDTWAEGEDGGPMIRTVYRAEIFDVSAVTYPAYTATSLGLRSAFTDTESAVRSLEAWRSSHIGDDLRRLKMKLARSAFRS